MLPRSLALGTFLLAVGQIYLGPTIAPSLSFSQPWRLNGVDLALGGDTVYGNLFISTTDSQAINKGGFVALGGRYSTTDTTLVNFGAIKGVKENGTNDQVGGALLFATANNGTGQTVERARLDSAGNWGVTGGISLGASATSNLTLSSVAPTGSGTGMTITVATGSTAVTWSVTITTANAQSAFTLNLPTVTNGWNCLANSRTNPGSRKVVMSSMTTATAVLTQYVQTTGNAGAYADADVIDGSCLSR